MNSMLRTGRVAAILAFACACFLGAAATAVHADTVRVQRIQQQADGWSRNMEVLLSAFTEDVVYEDVPLGLTLRGKEQVRQFAAGMFQAFPDLKSVCEVIVVQGDHGFCKWRFSGTQQGDMPNIPARGGRMDFPGVSHYQFEGDKIKHAVDYWDLNTMLRQLDALPPQQ